MSGATMHAIVRRRYGTPEVLSYEEIPRPVAGEHDVLVRVRAALVPTGTLVSTSGGSSGLRWLRRTAAMMLISSLSSRKLQPFMVSLCREDLLVLKELVEAGKIGPAIDRRYPLRETAEALRHVGEGHAQGLTVIQV